MQEQTISKSEGSVAGAFKPVFPAKEASAQPPKETRTFPRECDAAEWVLQQPLALHYAEFCGAFVALQGPSAAPCSCTTAIPFFVSWADAIEESRCEHGTLFRVADDCESFDDYAAALAAFHEAEARLLGCAE